MNLVCDRALLAGYVKGSRTITAGMVRQAAEEVAGERPAPAFRWHHGLIATGLTLALAVLAFAVAPRLAQAPEAPAPASAPLARPTPATAPTPTPPPPRSDRLDDDPPEHAASGVLRRRGRAGRGRVGRGRALAHGAANAPRAAAIPRPPGRARDVPPGSPRHLLRRPSPPRRARGGRGGRRPPADRGAALPDRRAVDEGRGRLVARAGRGADRRQATRGLGATEALRPRLHRAGDGRGGEPLPGIGPARSRTAFSARAHGWPSSRCLRARGCASPRAEAGREPDPRRAQEARTRARTRASPACWSWARCRGVRDGGPAGPSPSPLSLSSLSRSPGGGGGVRRRARPSAAPAHPRPHRDPTPSPVVAVQPDRHRRRRRAARPLASVGPPPRGPSHSPCRLAVHEAGAPVRAPAEGAPGGAG